MIRIRTKHGETVERGQALFESRIRAHVEPQYNGQFLALDVASGEYEMDANMLEALDKLKRRLPACEPYVVRIGHPTAVSLGGSRVAAS